LREKICLMRLPMAIKKPNAESQFVFAEITRFLREIRLWFFLIFFFRRKKKRPKAVDVCLLLSAFCPT